MSQKKPIQPQLLNTNNLNTFLGSGPSCTGNRMQMFSSELMNKQFESVFGSDLNKPKPCITAK